jgi:hypothetical protein
MKPTNRTPGARPGTEGNGKTYVDGPSLTSKPAERLAYPQRFNLGGRIKLTPLRYNGQFWGWLARTDKHTFCWGFTKAQAYHRLHAALRHKQAK